MKRTEYHRQYYWRNVEKRRRQRRESMRRLGKAHRYAIELRLYKSEGQATAMLPHRLG